VGLSVVPVLALNGQKHHLWHRHCRCLDVDRQAKCLTGTRRETVGQPRHVFCPTCKNSFDGRGECSRLPRIHHKPDGLTCRRGECIMSHRLFARFRVLTGMLALTAPLSCSGAADWQAAQIADALRAAPPTVTHTAKIYAWQPYGHLVLVCDGDGPYTCVASGSASLRFGKPPLSYPDPFCADQHAWAFIQAYWTEDDPDPTEAIRPMMPNFSQHKSPS
jgi:hypothetical protein